MTVTRRRPCWPWDSHLVIAVAVLSLVGSWCFRGGIWASEGVGARGSVLPSITALAPWTWHSCDWGGAGAGRAAPRGPAMGTPGCGEELRRDAFPGNQLCAFLGFWGGRNALRRFILCVGLMGRCSGQVCPHRGAERSRRPPSVGPRPVHEGLRRAKRRRRRNPRSAELERGSSPASRSGSPPPAPGSCVSTSGLV